MSMGGRRLAFSAGSLLAAVAGVAFIGLASALAAEAATLGGPAGRRAG